jgi:aldehyde dehydrogenase (NAD+)
MEQAESTHDLDDFPWERRRAWMARFEAELAGRALELSQLVAQEIGKPAGEALVSELLPLIASIRWHRRHARSALRPRRRGGTPWWMPGRSLRTARAPLGRVLIIATWNYPIGLLGVQLLQALVAGNRVTVKPSPRSLISQERLLGIARECGLPPGWLRGIDPSAESGRAAIESRDFDHVLFTGGSDTGTQVAAQCAATLTASTLELSGRDSAFVLADAAMDRAARSIWSACTMNAGQTCMAPRRVFVERGGARAFLQALAPLAAAARPLTLIDAEAARRCESLARDAVARGGRSASGVIDGAEGRRLRPLAIVDCPPQAPLFEGDHFGPVLAVVPVDSLAHAVALHRRVAHHLSASLFSARARRLSRDASLLAQLGASVVTCNECVLPTGHPALSIGGHGRSGWGRSRGVEGLLQMTRSVATTTTASWAPMPEAPRDRALAALAGLVRRISGGRAMVAEGSRQPSQDRAGAAPPVSEAARPDYASRTS